jgi:hypothetical protein
VQQGVETIVSDLVKQQSLGLQQQQILAEQLANAFVNTTLTN